MIQIKELNKEEVLAALYNNAKPQGKGVLDFDPTPMTKEDAQGLLDAGNTTFGYLGGRSMKINLSGDKFSAYLYDRDNVHKSAQKVIDELKSR